MPRRVQSLTSSKAGASTILPGLHRRTTACDLTALRLHSNGVRATSTRKQVSKTIRDARGNLIACDAGGRARVSGFEKQKRGVTRVEEDGEVIDIGLGDPEEKLKGGGKEIGTVREVKDVADHRAKKRRRFERDCDTFLEAPPRETGPSSLSVPSSNLLKTIHHFASNYYSKRGELFDGTARYRELRKERRRRKMEKSKEQIDSEHDSGSESESRKDCDVDEDEDNEESEFWPSPGSGGDGDGHKPHLQTDEGRRSPRKDMYRAFDGTALMAIGMILQEHVASLLVASNGDDGRLRAFKDGLNTLKDDLHRNTGERSGDVILISEGGEGEQG
ncbi:hypothetical protein BOTBODRAFT_625174 [Botryobasidium botryosum FD-172 SS1]|uniref:Uncharacterized protein n=1 Tax=Botryobasidium botryosum (strain FD-172 SS1) TaxID=930990 RepID=A0A067MV90_BOTB1|nr:hypothetical protein BOTBODRAFT_625174 [Botryobasidium botryosum FD-172 SS1]